MVTFWAIFKNITLKVKTTVATFWVGFVKIWATFYFSIWTHCSCNAVDYISFHGSILSRLNWLI